MSMTSEEAAHAAVRAYIEAFNTGDAQGMAGAFNFPHVRLAGGRFIDFPTAQDFITVQAGVSEQRKGEGFHHTTIEGMETVYAGDDKVHLAMDFARRRADDTIYERFHSLWIVTCLDGHWGVQFRSSFLSQKFAQAR